LDKIDGFAIGQILGLEQSPKNRNGTSIETTFCSRTRILREYGQSFVDGSMCSMTRTTGPHVNAWAGCRNMQIYPPRMAFRPSRSISICFLNSALTVHPEMDPISEIAIKTSGISMAWLESLQQANR